MSEKVRGELKHLVILDDDVAITPPPMFVTAFPVIIHCVIMVFELLQKIPPPEFSAEFPDIVQSVIAGDEFTQ